MPHLVPRLKPALLISSTGRIDEKVIDEETEDENARKFLEKMLTAVENARPGGRVYTQLLDAAASDLDRLAEMDLRMEGVARFSALYIRCLLLLRSIIKEFTIPTNTSISNTSSNIRNKITLLHKYSQQ
jgi:integrator complex subunit 4